MVSGRDDDQKGRTMNTKEQKMGSKALFADLSRASIPQGDPRAFVIAGVDTDDAWPENPLVDQESNAVTAEQLEPLVRSIQTAGFDGAIEVTKLGGRPLVVNGRRRVRAARIANERREAAGLPLVTVKAVPYQPGKNRDADLLGAVIRGNELRRAKGPLERARQAARLQQLGATVDDAATFFGVTSQAVRGWNDLLSLAPAVQAKVAEGAITASAARVVKGMSDADQVKTISDLMASGGKTTGAAVAKAARAKANGSTDAPPFVMVGKKEVRKAMDRYDLPPGVVAVLEWVMGERGESYAFANFDLRPEVIAATKAPKRRAAKVTPADEGFSIDDAPEA
jgi:ParB family chromosome partitioning protein